MTNMSVLAWSAGAGGGGVSGGVRGKRELLHLTAQRVHERVCQF